MDGPSLFGGEGAAGAAGVGHRGARRDRPAESGRRAGWRRPVAVGCRSRSRMFQPCPQRRASESDARASRADRRSGRRAGRLGADGPPDRPDPPAARRRLRPTTTTGSRSARPRSPSPNGRAAGLEPPDLAAHAPLAARPAGRRDRRARPRRPPAVRPAQHPLRHRLDQHAGLEHPQPVPRLPGAARRPHGALGLQARAVPRRAQPAGRRAALRRLVLLLHHRRGDRRLRRRLRRRGRRRSCARMPAPTAGSRSTRSCSPASARSPPRGLAVEDGEPVTERARAIKGPDDIRAMRCALHACETAMAAMRAAARPGLSEDDIWAVLHAENIRRGGEWIETRLLTSGPRTNPWFQECGPRIVQPNEILAFDTDLIGPYGYCADISRTWWIGDGTPRPDMRADHAPRLRADRLEHRAARAPAPASPSCTTAPSSCPSRTGRSATPASGTASGSATNGPTSSIPRTGCPAPSKACSSPAWCSASRA